MLPVEPYIGVYKAWLFLATNFRRHPYLGISGMIAFAGY
jgi:hypothetical protein